MGYKVEDTTIYLTRGDTGYFTFTPYVHTDDGDQVYEPQEGDSIRFAMKQKHGDTYEVLLTKPVDIETFQMKFEPEDTKGLAFGKYVYDVELTTASGDVDTYIPAVGEVANIIIEKEVDK